MKIGHTLSLLLFAAAAAAQVSITTDNSAPDAKAMLDIKSTDKGLLIPRMSSAQRAALQGTLTSAQLGLLVFDTNTSSFWFYDGGLFVELGAEIIAGTGISVSSNTITNTGDTDALNDITTGSPAGGDLGGSFPDPSVVKLRGFSVSGSTPFSGAVLKYSPTSGWEPGNDIGTTYTTGAGISFGTGTVITNTGILTTTNAGGDVSGTFSNLQIVANAVGPTELASNAVTTAKIADANVTTAKILDANITTAKIAANAVTNTKIGSAAATNGQALTADGAGNSTWATPATQKTIADADGNTKIEVEKNANEDKIRLSTNGTERVMVDNVGNVGIGTTAPNANALLDLSSTAKAFLPPRMTYSQIKAIAAPTAGMVVYDTEFGCLRFYNGAGWRCSDKVGQELGSPPGSFFGFQSTGAGNEFTNSVVTDASGNIYVAGLFTNGAATFGSTTLTNSGGNDAFIAKMNSSGAWQWAVKAGGNGWDSANGIAIDASNNLYVTGYFNTTVSFGGTSLTSMGSSDVFVAKINDSGAWQWAVQAGGASNGEEAHGIALDASGNIYVVGEFYSATMLFAGIPSLTNAAAPTSDVFVAKLNNAGTWVWAAKSQAVNNEIGSSITLDGSSNVYICGNFTGYGNFGGITLNGISGGTGSDLYVAKLNSSGNWQAAVIGGGTSSDAANAIAVDANNNLYITGYFTGTGTFGSYSTGATGQNMLVAKLSSGLVYQWPTYANVGGYNCVGRGISTDAAGNVYVTGNFYGTGNFGPTSLSSYNDDVFVAKIDNAASWKWAEKGGGTSEDWGTCIKSDPNGNLTMGGHFYATAFFGNNQMTAMGGSKDVFIWKYAE